MLVNNREAIAPDSRSSRHLAQIFRNIEIDRLFKIPLSRPELAESAVEIFAPVCRNRKDKALK
jgi:DNA-binding TFAR19-related protein (PDSD5 family)